MFDILWGVLSSGKEGVGLRYISSKWLLPQEQRIRHEISCVLLSLQLASQTYWHIITHTLPPAPEPPSYLSVSPNAASSALISSASQDEDEGMLIAQSQEARIHAGRPGT
ncbi:hypothetical protein BDZ91DRAFT_181019 [Kalaharituber pfeilii]|nr:hypothetical protein BDZ91DRAFT_181019 [Kalaharituber pfeilii]